MKNWKLIVITILVALLLIVILQNSDPVKTRFLVWSMTLPQAALIGLVGVLGFLVGMLVALRMTGRKHATSAGSRTRDVPGDR